MSLRRVAAGLRRILVRWIWISFLVCLALLPIQVAASEPPAEVLKKKR